MTSYVIYNLNFYMIEGQYMASVLMIVAAACAQISIFGLVQPLATKVELVFLSRHNHIAWPPSWDKEEKVIIEWISKLEDSGSQLEMIDIGVLAVEGHNSVGEDYFWEDC